MLTPPPLNTKRASLADVISTLEQVMELPSKSTTESLYTKEMAALAAEVLDELVLYMLTTAIKPNLSEEYCVWYVTRHFVNCGITPRSLESLLITLRLARQQ